MMIRFKQVLFNSALVLGLAGVNIGGAAFANEGSGLILPNFADSNIEFALKEELGDLDPTKVLQVFVGPLDTCCAAKSPIAGRYFVTGRTIVFDPSFDFITDQNYTVVTRKDDGNSKTITSLKEFSINSASETIKSEVLMIYPSAATLPENTLRFYIHFSTPMKPHLATKFIKLVDAEGNEDTTAFMKFKQELWSEDRRRLTLLMDPGRIKRGVAQNLTQGPALLEGKSYSIVVDEGWPSASGKQEMSKFKKTFSVTSALRTLPNTKFWRIDSPEISTVNPLLIIFDRPFDHQLAKRSIRLLDEGGSFIPGKVSIEANEKAWRFHPKQAWSGASIQVVVDARLEDVAGNNFKDLLDHSIETEMKNIHQIRFTVELKSVIKD